MIPLSQSVTRESLEDATLREVCEYHRVSADDVRGTSHLEEHVEARHDWWATLWASVVELFAHWARCGSESQHDQRKPLGRRDGK